MGRLRDAVSIAALHAGRLKQRGPLLQRMQIIRDQVNGDVVVPMPQFQDRQQENYVANLAQQGLDNYGRRIAGVDPELFCPPTDPRKEGAKRKADIRRKANLGWWEASNIRNKRFRRARHLIGYASSPVSIRPDVDRGIPTWVARNPLNAFPAPTVDPDDMCPTDTLFTTRMPIKQVAAKWPAQAAAICGSSRTLMEQPDRLATLIEYCDAEQISYVLSGWADVVRSYSGSPGVLLSTVPNRAGVPLDVVPGRITLDRPQGQFDGIIGMWQMQAKLMALEVMAVQKGVFPDMWMISRPNETARIISGPHPGYTGKINEIEGGDIRYEQLAPGFQTNPTIDRLERSQRVEAGISSEFGGESGTNIRTGRRGDSIMSAMIDFPIQEAQLVLATSAEEENFRATKVASAWFGNQAKSFYVRWKGAAGHVDYTPNKDFDSNYTTVTYPMAGSDIQNLTIGIASLRGTDLMSTETAMRLHPWIADADLEGDRVKAEGLEKAVMQSFQQQAASGQLPISDAARISQLVLEQNMPTYQAILQAQKEAQDRQAAQTPDEAENPAAAGVDPNSPAAQPGLAAPGMGAEAGVAVPDPTTAMPSLANLDQLSSRLRRTNRMQPAG